MVYRLIAAVMICFIILAGCEQNDETSLPDKESNNQYEQVKDSDREKQSNPSNKEIANHLADIAGTVPNVNNANAVVAGPYAVVGIDVDKDLDRSRVSTIKYSVTEGLHHDPYGKTAVVVTDGDITERLKDMNDKIGQGHPVQGMVDELSAIVGRYMPDTPPNDKQPKESDQNKEMMPEKNEEELDDIQRDQVDDDDDHDRRESEK